MPKNYAVIFRAKPEEPEEGEPQGKQLFLMSHIDENGVVALELRAFSIAKGDSYHDLSDSSIVLATYDAETRASVELSRAVIADLDNNEMPAYMMCRESCQELVAEMIANYEAA